MNAQWFKLALDVAQAAQEWEDAKAWAHENASLMLSSRRTGDEAAEIMRRFFDKETALLEACRALRAVAQP